MSHRREDEPVAADATSDSQKLDETIVGFVTKHQHVRLLDLLAMPLPDELGTLGMSATLTALGTSVDKLVTDKKLVWKQYGNQRGLALPGV